MTKGRLTLSLLIALLLSTRTFASIFSGGDGDGYDSVCVEQLQPTGPAPTIIYVYADATGANDGTSWVNAYTNLQDGLATASNNCEIWVAAGTYIPGTNRTATFQMREWVDLYGGFNGTETNKSQRDWNANLTILSGDIGVQGTNTDNSYHVVTGTNNATIDGFTISGGTANWSSPNDCGGGMYNINASLSILNCTFNGNSGYQGGGMANNNSSPMVQNCTFNGNSVLSTNGGGIYNFNDSSPTLQNCVFNGNSAGAQGGGIANDNSSPMVQNCMFSGNSAGYAGGGMYNNNNSSLTVQNCTFSGNLAPAGGGMYNMSGSSPAFLTNCILWANSAITSGDEIYNASTCTVSYCDIQGGIGGIAGGGVVFTNGVNLDADPLFVGGTNGTWSLDATFNPTNFQSTLTGDTNSSWWAPGELAGKFINPDTNQVLQYLIVSNDTYTLTVWGDFSTNALNAKPYQIFDYHVKSTAGHWESGFGIWTNDAVTSPCIDAGDPASVWTNEPPPNGSRINMGAYGNTTEASKSGGGAPPTVNNNGGASNITATSATLNGNLTSTGGAPTTVFVYWNTIDGVTNKVAWTNEINMGTLGPGLFSTNISGLSSNTLYYYRCWASNASGIAWAPTTTNFTTFNWVPGLDWQLITAAAGWDAREVAPALVFDNKMWVIAGYSIGAGYKNDVWSSPNGLNWTQVTASAPWAGRSEPECVVFSNRMWVLGGEVASGVRANDVWWSTDGTNWTQATGSAPWAARYSHRCVVFDNKLWLFGGQAGGVTHDVWVSADGTNWTEVTSAAPWTARCGHGAVVFGNRMWVIGGAGSDSTNDVWWSEDGTNWTCETAAAPWTTRYRHTSVVFDDRIWVLGGQSVTGPTFLNDVWSSADGTNWVQATASAPWSVRWVHGSVVFDNRMWVLGGDRWDGSYIYTNDVWCSPPKSWLTDGLIAYYPFNGNANDESGNGNHGTVNGATLTADRFGNTNATYDFDGVDDYIACPTGIALSNDFSIAFDIKFDQPVPTNYYCYVFSKHETHANTDGGWIVGVDNSNRLDFGYYPDGIYHVLSDPLVLGTGLWHHMAITFDDAANALKMYCDGVPIKSVTEDVRIWANSTPFYHGAAYSGSGPEQFGASALDEIRLYNRAISSNEVRQLYTLGDVDSDSDGLPDWWETQYFGDLAQTASGDPDGDGSTNLEEYQNGTDPTVGLPGVDNAGGASDITANSATLMGNLTSTGGAPTTVYIYWGDNDGGTVAANWDNTCNLGTLGVGLFSTNISGLASNTTYYYRCFATNSYGEDWADSTTNFTTWVDADGDGLPDWWEMANFGNTNYSGADDPDGDFWANSNEYAAASQPTNANHFPMPAVGSSMGCAVFGDKIYLVGGHDGPGALDSVLEFNLSNNQYTNKAQLPVSRRSLRLVVMGTNLYAIGGTPDPVASSAVYRYDPVGDTWWTNVASMLTARSYFASTELNGKIYVFGGSSDGVPFPNCEVYDSALNSWTAISNLSYQSSMMDAVLGVDTNIYIFAVSSSATNLYNQLAIYDPFGDTYMFGSPLPSPRPYLGAVAAGNDTVVLVAGGLPSTNSIVSYSPSVGTWDTLLPYSLIQDRESPGVAIVSNTVYVFGGQSGSTFLQTVEKIPLEMYTVTAIAGTNGTITPSGVLSAVKGSSKNFTITPATNYYIEDVVVDGSSIGATNSYTFSNIMSNHTITANFGALPPEPVMFEVYGMPSGIMTGEVVNITVKAWQGTNIWTMYTGTVSFSSVDTNAMLPTNYTFQVSDNGVHVFSNAVAFYDWGDGIDVVVMDVANTNMRGIHADIVVFNGYGVTAEQYAIWDITDPILTGQWSSVSVAAVDEEFGRVTNYTGQINFSSSDTNAWLPIGGTATYLFSAGDYGLHTFSNDLKFYTVGEHWLQVQDTGDTNIVTKRWNLTAMGAGTSTNTTHFVLEIDGSRRLCSNGWTELIIEARNQYEQTVTNFVGTVTFTCSDPLAVYPSNYTFTAYDNGRHPFGDNSLQFNTIGTHWIEAYWVADTNIFGGIYDIEISEEAGPPIITNSLAVSSAYGSPVPGTGTMWYVQGTNVDAYVPDSPVSAGAGTQYVCRGWTGSGDVPTPGTGTNVSFVISNDSTIIWLWATEYQLSVGVYGYGSVDVAGGWYPMTTNVMITATPSNGYHFVNWTGDLTSTNNPLILTMSQAYTLTANFEMDDMVLIKGGTFQMGADINGHGGHTVTLGDFYIDRKEVTIGEFQTFCTAMERSMPSQPVTNSLLPVVNVTWHDATNYAAWAGKRLPTEAEYEYAMRGGQCYDQAYPFGNTINASKANYHMNVGQSTDVGSYPVTGAGIFDIGGNVWEWCSDWHQDVLTGPVTDPTGPASGTKKVIRGGSWASSAETLKCWYRYPFEPDVRYIDLGFRCVESAGSGAMSDSDTNVNGIPDWWETWYFGTNTFDSTADSDDDGMINWQEYIAGTDPTDPGSVLVIECTASPADTFVIQWPSVQGRLYTVERSTNLVSGFTALVTDIPATPLMNTYTDAVGTVSAYYYRVKVQQ